MKPASLAIECADTLPASRIIHPSILYFGTPVALISTQDTEGHVNLSPMSSAWALGNRILLGMGKAGKGCRNLMQTGEAVINLPGPDLHEAVEAIAATTGRADVPEYKRAMGYHYEADKFSAAGLTPQPSQLVKPPRVAECPLQLEARLLVAHHGSVVDGDSGDYVTLEMLVLRVHAHEAILLQGSEHIDTERWSPLLYVFRHYFGTGAKLGKNFRAET